MAWVAAAVITLPCVASTPASGETAAARSKAGASSHDEVRRKFEQFAAEWMDKLRQRQKHNVANLEWHARGQGVESVYIGYDTANYQILPLTNLDSVPIGKLVYMELKLRVVGPSRDAALSQEPQVIERVEVTELFRYQQGKWVY
jgi:hypothetical protein